MSSACMEDDVAREDWRVLWGIIQKTLWQWSLRKPSRRLEGQQNTRGQSFVFLFLFFKLWCVSHVVTLRDLELLRLHRHHREGTGLWFGHKLRKTNANFIGKHSRKIYILHIAWEKARWGEQVAEENTWVWRPCPVWVHISLLLVICQHGPGASHCTDVLTAHSCQITWGFSGVVNGYWISFWVSKFHRN